MERQIQKIKKLREFLLAQIAGLTVEQLNKVPEGYNNNNIVWNMAHLICAQQALCYLRAGQVITVDEKWVAPYRTGTKPAAFVEEKEIEEIKSTLMDSIEQLQIDYDRHLFGTYAPSENILKVYGVELSTIDDALEFLLYHEGYHSGYIIAMIRLLHEIG